MGTAHRRGGREHQKCPSLPKIFYTYPEMMKLDAVISYLKNILFQRKLANFANIVIDWIELWYVISNSFNFLTFQVFKELF